MFHGNLFIEPPIVVLTILGALSTTIIQFAKKVLPTNGLTKLAAVAGLSAVVGVVGAFVAEVDLGTQQGAFFLSVVFAYSQIGWGILKNIRDVTAV